MIRPAGGDMRKSSTRQATSNAAGTGVVSRSVAAAGIAAAILAWMAAVGASAAGAADGGTALAGLVSEALAIRTPTRSAAEYADATAAARALLDRLRKIDRTSLGLEDQVDRDLLEAKLRTRVFEIEELRLHTLTPASYFALSQTDALFLRPGALSDAAVREATEELRRLPKILASARANLEQPARVWTENAIAQAYYAKLLLRETAPGVAADDAAVKREFLAAAAAALGEVESFEVWLRSELLPRSTRSPAWKPSEIEHYQFVHEQLDEYGVDAMIRIAEQEERQLDAEMRELARRIHPSGDLATVWRLMKEEAPPWDGVIPMAQRYVDWMARWLQGPGARIVGVPDFDYGARLATPMARRTLSFGGADYGPTVAGRLSGYYILTPLEETLTPDEKLSRLRSYNPYWTHVISYHEWLGHTVQRAYAEKHVTRPLRHAYGSAYLSQAWSFYLEKLMEDEGYYATLPYMEELKTRMARRQMRMWRVQRILTKCRMARGELGFDEAVRAYVEKIGMEPGNAFIEVQRDSQTPSPPGREIVGERAILALRAEYEKRMAEHATPRRFHESLLSYGEIPFKQIRRLMFGD